MRRKEQAKIDEEKRKDSEKQFNKRFFENLKKKQMKQNEEYGKRLDMMEAEKEKERAEA